METKPLFTSKCKAINFWQKYAIYADRLEFDTLFGLMVIPFGQIENISVSESEIKGMLKGDLHLKDFRPALKLDWANFSEHVVVDRNSGGVRRILFTPSDPREFSNVLKQALLEYQNNQK